MGKCGTRPRKVSLLELKDIDIGGEFELRQGCGPNIVNAHIEQLKHKGFGWPENGEFEDGGWGGECGMCSADGHWGCECSGVNAIKGSRPKVKRKAFLADPSECCMANIPGKESAPFIGDLTCDPKYRDPNMVDCTNLYRPRCNGDKILNETCKKLKTSNSTLFGQLMGEYCNSTADAANKQECIEWCGSGGDCSKLRTITDCKKYDIPDANCTPAAILDITTECKTLGIVSSTDLTMGSFKCTESSIKELRAACLEHGLVDGKCTSNGVDIAIANKISQDFASESRSTIDGAMEMLNRALGDTSPSTSTSTPSTIDTNFGTIMGDFFGEYTTYIIIIIGLVLFCCCSLSSSILGVIGMSGKKKVKFSAPTGPRFDTPTGPSFGAPGPSFGAPTPTDFGSPIIEAPPAYNQDFIKMSS